jgi:hypothetical protein
VAMAVIDVVYAVAHTVRGTTGYLDEQ